LLDKPVGLSSNQALGKAKRIIGIRKAGHAGTLDPFATGLLLCAFAQATKVNAFLLEADKTYQAELKLGQATSTADIEGEITATSVIPQLTLADWQQLADTLIGDLEQTPPMYSALKHQGQPLYKLARQGKTVERKARQITIHSLKILAWETPLLRFEVRCSKGTYVRTLGEQLAGLADSVGHLVSLRRTSIGQFKAEQMLTIQQLENSKDPLTLLLPADQALLGYPQVILTKLQSKAFLHGQSIAVDGYQQKLCRVYSETSVFLGLGKYLADGQFKAERVFLS